MFPPAMLNNVYVRGSLKNTGHGFELTLRNNIDYGTIVGIGTLVADDVTYAPSAITLRLQGRDLRGEEVSYSKSAAVPVGAEVQLVVTGAPLAPGSHRLSLSLTESQVGRLRFEVTDIVA